MNYLVHKDTDYQEGNYKIDAGVEEFVKNNVILMPVLLAIPLIIQKYFKNVSLELSYREDLEENYSNLFLKIATDLPISDAFQQKRALFKDTFFKQFIGNPEINNLLTFHTAQINDF